ncbi:MAG: membrane protein insertase YidC [Anaerolineae bacterium]|nr:MAG: membrane protein insertase YidC [Anaerolineae bacterium]
MSKKRTVGLLIVLLAVMLLLTSCGAPTTTDPNAPPQGLWQTLVVYPMSSILVWINDALASIGIPYSFGFAIIIFTVLIKVITLPLTRKQMQSMKATQELQPKLQELQKKHGKDREALSKAQMELYKEAGVNPLGGCLPLLIQMPILFGLYQSLYHLASVGELVNQPFFWIPDLSFPTAQGGLGWISNYFQSGQIWLLIAYLILPIVLVVTQIMMQKMSQPPRTSNQPQDSQQAMMGQMMLFMPVMFGFFSLQVPSGLSLYWVTSNLLAMGQQYSVTGWGHCAYPA